ncbi:MAG TPA: 1-acyl-sn-glycerol-3-phosphate acyltransferase [Peptococcaceae bacterium]|nr:MAG: 1-acyl-sn-glycerol-3-phosphate acyltransferase PlsC [Clostridia bacterium 41_269]HBT20516.1 1-acyl-sn-glycerol-3-phosphate acyltransferase [Peptococcaceae bacterium]
MMYKLGKAFFYFLFTYICRWKVRGADNVPQKGPAVIVSNHLSLWDPLVVGAAVKRRVYFMAKAELFRYPLVGIIVRSWGAFPVKRGRLDREALKNAMRVLQRGDVLGIFPEGRRSVTGKLQEFKPGAVSLAVKYGAPIVPVGLIGTKKIFYRGWFRSFEVNIGEPIPTKEFKNKDADIEKLNRMVWEKVAELSGQK